MKLSARLWATLALTPQNQFMLLTCRRSMTSSAQRWGKRCTWRCKISWQAYQHFLRVTDISPTEKSVLLCLAFYYNEERHYAWPSQLSISRHTCFTKRTISRAVNGLQEKGFVLVQRAVWEYSGSPASNLYYFPSLDPGAKITNRPVLRTGSFSKQGEWDETIDSS